MQEVEGSIPFGSTLLLHEEPVSGALSNLYSVQRATMVDARQLRVAAAGLRTGLSDPQSVAARRLDSVQKRAIPFGSTGRYFSSPASVLEQSLWMLA
jgi:hypothetical protein